MTIRSKTKSFLIEAKDETTGESEKTNSDITNNANRIDLIQVFLEKECFQWRVVLFTGHW